MTQNITCIPLDDTENYFYTYCLSTAAALVQQDYKIESIDKTNPNKVRFIFKRLDGLDETARRHWDDELMVGSQRYFETIKKLKQRIYSA